MKKTIPIFGEALNFIKSFVSLSGMVFSQCWKRPFYYRLIVQNIYDFAYRSLFIVTLFGVATSIVLTLHIGLSLKKYGAALYVPKILTLSVISEISPVILIFILAGRIGAGITSEIASMKVSEQLDALKALGVSPIKRVIIPKVLGCLITIPILSVFFTLVALLASAYVGKMQLFLDPVDFLARGLRTPPLSMFLFSVLKTVAFSLIIAITSCHYGLNITKGSYEIGRATMKAIVISFILIILGDFILTKFYYAYLWPGQSHYK